VIQEIMNDLAMADAEPNQVEEVNRIRAVCQKGKTVRVKFTRIDVMLKGKTVFSISSILKRPSQTLATLRSSSERCQSGQRHFLRKIRKRM